MKKEKVHLFTMLLGAFLALAIVCTQVFAFSESRTSKQSAKTEQQANKKDQTGEEKTFSQAPTFSVLPTSAHVQLNLEIYCLFDIIHEEKPQEIQRPECAIHPEKFFQTLFRVIIAPNAP